MRRMVLGFLCLICATVHGAVVIDEGFDGSSVNSAVWSSSGNVVVNGGAVTLTGGTTAAEIKSVSKFLVGPRGGKVVLTMYGVSGTNWKGGFKLGFLSSSNHSTQRISAVDLESVSFNFMLGTQKSMINPDLCNATSVMGNTDGDWRITWTNNRVIVEHPLNTVTLDTRVSAPTTDVGHSGWDIPNTVEMNLVLGSSMANSMSIGRVVVESDAVRQTLLFDQFGGGTLNSALWTNVSTARTWPPPLGSGQVTLANLGAWAWGEGSVLNCHTQVTGVTPAVWAAIESKDRFAPPSDGIIILRIGGPWAAFALKGQYCYFHQHDRRYVGFHVDETHGYYDPCDPYRLYLRAVLDSADMDRACNLADLSEVSLTNPDNTLHAEGNYTLYWTDSRLVAEKYGSVGLDSDVDAPVSAISYSGSAHDYSQSIPVEPMPLRIGTYLNDLQMESVAVEQVTFPSSVKGDLNSDNKINFADFAKFAQDWGLYANLSLPKMYDDFEGTSLKSALWDTFTYDGGGTVTVGGGKVTIKSSGSAYTNRMGIISKLAIASDADHAVVLRSSSMFADDYMWNQQIGLAGAGPVSSDYISVNMIDSTGVAVVIGKEGVPAQYFKGIQNGISFKYGWTITWYPNRVVISQDSYGVLFDSDDADQQPTDWNGIPQGTWQIPTSPLRAYASSGNWAGAVWLDNVTFKQVSPVEGKACDLNEDGVLDNKDLALLAGAWLEEL